MTLLWLGIALLTVIAVGFIYFPYLRATQRVSHADRTEQNVTIFKERLAELDRERASGTLQPAEYEELKQELEKNLLEDAGALEVVEQPVVKKNAAQLLTVTLMALLIPALALGLYVKYGSAKELQVALESPQVPHGKQPSVEEALGMLQQELAANPQNPEGWYILASTYMNLGEFGKGAEAFTKVIAQLPKDAPQYPGVMGQYAQALYFANGGMSDEVRQQIERTLDIEPQEVTALGLLGIDAFEQKAYEQAIDHWRAALRNADTGAAESLKTGIRRAMDELAAAGKPVPEVPELAQVRLDIQVDISAELAAKVQADQPVFVFARPVGSRMPVAAKRLTVADLPTTVILDDSAAMMPQAKLSDQTAVEIGVRISTSGQPQASSGDFEASVQTVQLDQVTEPVRLLIDQIVQ